MKSTELNEPPVEELLSGFRHEHVHFQFYHYQGGPRPRLTSEDLLWAPPVDCYDTVHEVVIEVNLAGIPAGDVQVHVGPRSVHIAGSRREEESEATRCYHVLEIERGKFSRTIQLPDVVDSKKAEAQFEGGMLILRLPRLFGSPYAGCSPAGSIKDFDDF